MQTSDPFEIVADYTYDWESWFLPDIRLCLAASNELLEDLVDISRLDAGVTVPAVGEVAVADLFEKLETGFRAEAEARKLDLRLVPASLFVRADPAMLHRILQNLVANALRYTPSGRVLVGCRRRGKAVAIEVWDTGIGIAAGETERIFEEFYQVDNAERDRRRGAGLGLAIVRRLAALMGAEVTVGSRPGRGSVFALTLPLADSCRPHPVAAPAGRAQDFTGLTIAILDDEPMQLTALRSFLTGRRASVIAATSLPDTSPEND